MPTAKNVAPVVNTIQSTAPFDRVSAFAHNFCASLSILNTPQLNNQHSDTFGAQMWQVFGVLVPIR